MGEWPQAKELNVDNDGFFLKASDIVFSGEEWVKSPTFTSKDSLIRKILQMFIVQEAAMRLQKLGKCVINPYPANVENMVSS